MTIEIEDEFSERVRELLWYLRDRKEQMMSGSIEFHTDKQGNTQQGKATLNGGFSSMKTKIAG